uniref:HAT C-terminal dimerisation domain-containing protein n=1 Tax=Ananas comosus var. bracteatus TaxID=296719 RepID=A0A6V7QV00_ANACO
MSTADEVSIAAEAAGEVSVAAEAADDMSAAVAEVSAAEEVAAKMSVEAMREEGFDEHDSIEDREVLDPKKWWVIYGAAASMLQNLTLKLLGQPCSSSCCERNWSTYSFIYSMKRNKITPQRAEDLVYVHTNLRLLSRRAPEYIKGETKIWDVGGDSFDIYHSVDLLKIANLSLDEPDLESVGFGTIPYHRIRIVSCPYLRIRRRQLLRPRLLPLLHHHRRLRHRRLPLRDKAEHPRAVHGERVIDRIMGGFMYAYQNSAGRLTGFFPNDAEVARYRKK